MGLFALPLSDTPEGNVKEAEANLRLYWEEGKPAHCLSSAIHCLKEALKKIELNTKEPSHGD